VKDAIWKVVNFNLKAPLGATTMLPSRMDVDVMQFMGFLGMQWQSWSMEELDCFIKSNILGTFDKLVPDMRNAKVVPAVPYGANSYWKNVALTYMLAHVKFIIGHTAMEPKDLAAMLGSLLFGKPQDSVKWYGMQYYMTFVKTELAEWMTWFSNHQLAEWCQHYEVDFQFAASVMSGTQAFE
jgi:hypothetical protein